MILSVFGSVLAASDGCGVDECFGALSALLAVWSIAIGFGLVIGLGFYIWTAISLQRFFRRVGVAETWAGWVPFYGWWKLLEVGGFAGWWSLVALAGFVIPGASYVTTVFLCMAMYRIDRAMGRGSGFWVLGLFLSPVWAWMNGDPARPYHPEALVQSGWPPPRAGFGAVVDPTQREYYAQQAAQQRAYAQQQQGYPQQQGYAQQQQYPQQPYAQQYPQQPYAQQYPQQQQQYPQQDSSQQGQTPPQQG